MRLARPTRASCSQPRRSCLPAQPDEQRTQTSYLDCGCDCGCVVGGVGWFGVVGFEDAGGGVEVDGVAGELEAGGVPEGAVCAGGTAGCPGFVAAPGAPEGGPFSGRCPGWIVMPGRTGIAPG